MNKPDNTELTEQDIMDVMQAQRDQLQNLEHADELLSQTELVYQLWWRWADFHLFIVSPSFPSFTPPKIIRPEYLESQEEYEFVYPIVDYGDHLSTSKGLESVSTGLSMYKLYCTIEKMIALLIERLKSGGISAETEVQVAFAGHELSQRKGFESIINLSYNVVVSNYDPGEWGKRYLEIVKRMAEKGYGYPPTAPRDVYRRVHHVPTQ